MISIVPCKMRHIIALPELMDVFKNEPNVKERLMDYLEQDNCVMLSILYNGCCVGILGGFFIWERSMSIFTAFSKELARRPVSMVRAVRAAIEYGFREFNLLRMQIEVKTEESHLHKWARTIGFVRECDMKNYGPNGESYSLYARYE